MHKMWNVYFDSGFTLKSPNGSHPGQPLTLNCKFRFSDREWIIPIAYLTSKGIVLDILQRADKSALEAFTEKWAYLEDEDDVPETLYAQAERENPLIFEFKPQLFINEKAAPFAHGYGLSYRPQSKNAAALCEAAPSADAAYEDGASLETLTEREIIDHYHLDPEAGWAIHRYAFPWQTKRRPKTLSSLQLTLTPQPVRIPGDEFEVQNPGDTVSFSHNETEYTLTVQSIAPQTLPENVFRDAQFDFPRCLTEMTYTISPPPPENSVYVEDAGTGDRPTPRKAPENTFAPEAQNSACIGIIGGADGPTAVFVSGKGTSPAQAACSALYFAPPEKITWRIVFSETPFAPETISLL